MIFEQNSFRSTHGVVMFFSSFRHRLGAMGGDLRRSRESLVDNLKGIDMGIRKIGVIGCFTAGAALAFAPIAAATTDPLISVVGGEESLLNSLFVGEADLAGIPASDYSLVDGFDVINAADIAKDAPATAPFSTLDYELFGISPGLAGVASDPGSYNVFNGALTEWSDAYNVELYSLL